MIEFGSDFHFVSSPRNCSNHSLQDYYPCASYYADGRQVLIDLFKNQRWKRLWVPEYFCYDVFLSLSKAGVSLVYYPDSPIEQDQSTIERLPFHNGDAILRVNYFGLRGFRSNAAIPIPVVEDHSHDLIGDWAIHSDADWCIASLRKSLPIAEGGILWSPKRYPLPSEPSLSDENSMVAKRRWRAMQVKSEYLLGSVVNKSSFRNEFLSTEFYFDNAEVSCIDEKSKDYLSAFNVFEWYGKKAINWKLLCDISTKHFRVLVPEGTDCFPFSYTIICDSPAYRDRLRHLLIENCIYPAILWDIPKDASQNAIVLSSRVLSIHCDGRYQEEDIMQMKSIIESLL